MSAGGTTAWGASGPVQPCGAAPLPPPPRGSGGLQEEGEVDDEKHDNDVMKDTKEMMTTL